MNSREFRDYLRSKRLEAIRADVRAEKKPPASETQPLKIRRKAK